MVKECLKVKSNDQKVLQSKSLRQKCCKDSCHDIGHGNQFGHQSSFPKVIDRVKDILRVHDEKIDSSQLVQNV